LDAIRAAAKTDPTRRLALLCAITRTGRHGNKNIQVDSIMAQAQEDEANAAYLRKASSDAAQR